MKLILATEGVKRQIEGPFEMCTSRADAERLRDILDELLREDRRFVYGWFRVADRIETPTNTPPLKWTE